MVAVIFALIATKIVTKIVTQNLIPILHPSLSQRSVSREKIYWTWATLLLTVAYEEQQSCQ